jgi:hypothetical protein
MPALYEIAKDIQLLMLRLEDGDGEMSPELAESLDGLEMAFEAKVDNVLRYRAEMDANANVIDAEIQRLTALRDGYKRRAETLKRYVFQTMQSLGVDRVQCKLFSCWVQKNGRPSIGLAAAAEIPETYRKVTVTFDSQKCYEDWKAGQTLPECVTVTEGYHLRIK